MGTKIIKTSYDVALLFNGDVLAALRCQDKGPADGEDSWLATAYYVESSAGLQAANHTFLLPSGDAPVIRHTEDAAFIVRRMNPEQGIAIIYDYEDREVTFSPTWMVPAFPVGCIEEQPLPSFGLTETLIRERLQQALTFAAPDSLTIGEVRNLLKVCVSFLTAH